MLTNIEAIFCWHKRVFILSVLLYCLFTNEFKYSLETVYCLRKGKLGILPFFFCFVLVWWRGIGSFRLFSFSSKLLLGSGPPHMARQKQDDQHEHTFSRYVSIRDVVLKTCQRRWMIGKSGERGSGISVLVVWRDDDDNDDISLDEDIRITECVCLF